MKCIQLLVILLFKSFLQFLVSLLALLIKLYVCCNWRQEVSFVSCYVCWLFLQSPGTTKNIQFLLFKNSCITYTHFLTPPSRIV